MYNCIKNFRQQKNYNLRLAIDNMLSKTEPQLFSLKKTDMQNHIIPLCASIATGLFTAGHAPNLER